MLRQAGATVAHLGQFGGGDAGRRRFFQHLLVAALQRAVAAAQPRNCGVAWSHLDFHVARVERNFSMYTVGLPKAGAPPARVSAKPGERGFLCNHPHAAPAAAARRLHDDTGSRSVRDGLCTPGPPDSAIRPWHAGHAGARIARMATLSPMVRIDSEAGGR